MAIIGKENFREKKRKVEKKTKEKKVRLKKVCGHFNKLLLIQLSRLIIM